MKYVGQIQVLCFHKSTEYNNRLKAKGNSPGTHLISAALAEKQTNSEEIND